MSLPLIKEGETGAAAQVEMSSTEEPRHSTMGTADNTAAEAGCEATLTSVRDGKGSHVAVRAVPRSTGPGTACVELPQMGYARTGAIPKTGRSRPGEIRHPESAVHARTGGVPGVGPDQSGAYLVPSVMPSHGFGNMTSREAMASGRRETRSTAKAQRAGIADRVPTHRIPTAQKCR